LLPRFQTVLNEQLLGRTLFANDAGSVSIKKIDSCTGEFSGNQRKGKRFIVYDFEIKFEFEANLVAGTTTRGKYIFPSVDSVDGLSGLEVILKPESDQFEKKDANAFAKAHGLPAIRKILVDCVKFFESQFVSARARETPTAAVAPPQPAAATLSTFQHRQVASEPCSESVRMMTVFVKDARLRRHSVDVDEGASVAHLKLLLANMSLVPAGFVPNLVYQTRNLSDGDCVGGIGYSPDLSISLVCVRAAPASAAADCKPHSSLSPTTSTAAAASRAFSHSSTPSPVTSAASASNSGSKSAPSSSPTTAAAPSTAPAAAKLQHGSRVRIEGLQAKPEMNGRTGVVCGGADQESGRWTVDIDAGGATPACRGTFRAANLRLIAPHNLSTEWVDEGGRVWPKNVDFSRQCAKGHALAPLGERGGQADRRLMCRLCHCFCERDCDEAASWLMCSEDAGCCGEYAVCCSCARSPSAAAAGSEDFSTLVSCKVEWCVRELTLCGAGRGGAVPVVAAVDSGMVAGPHDNVCVLPAVRAPVHVVQPRQRDGAADGAGRHCAACGRSDVVHQPRV
jgi:hypothetical protein